VITYTLAQLEPQGFEYTGIAVFDNPPSYAIMRNVARRLDTSISNLTALRMKQGNWYIFYVPKADKSKPFNSTEAILP
jgi:hypothetical protein